MTTGPPSDSVSEADVNAGGEPVFPGRLGVVQRVMAQYQLPLLDLLASRCARGLSVFAGPPAAWESLDTGNDFTVAQIESARNVHLFRDSFYLCWQARQRQWLDRWQPDVLVVEANPRLISAPIATWSMRRRGRPVLGWGLGLGGAEHAPRMLATRRLLRVPFFRQFDGMLAYGSRAAAQYRQIGFPPEMVFVCKNAVTPAPPLPPPDRPKLFPARPVVLFVGRLSHGKRVDVLLRAFAVLQAHGYEPLPSLRIVGDGPELASLKEQAAEVCPDAVFVGGRHGEELVAEFDRADLFVMPGQGGLAVQEAMSHALPIVVGDGDGTQYDLVQNGNGWHVRPGDPGSVAKAIRAALADVAHLRAMGAESFRIVREEVNINRLADAIVCAVNTVSGAVAAPTVADTIPAGSAWLGE
jgi:glycosyltransferase involved in cell wall biosynthesis